MKNLKINEIVHVEYGSGATSFEYDGQIWYGIIKIVTDQFEILAEEDTGGELAMIELDYQLKVGDVISFYGELNEYDELFGADKMNINGIDYPISVNSMGGNRSVYLVFSKINA